MSDVRVTDRCLCCDKLYMRHLRQIICENGLPQAMPFPMPKSCPRCSTAVDNLLRDANTTHLFTVNRLEFYH